MGRHVVISSTLAYALDLAVINCCPSDDPLLAAAHRQRITSDAKEAWHDGAQSPSAPDRAEHSRAGNNVRCEPPEVQVRTCSGF